MRILILSRSNNVHADAVETHCRDYSRVVRINFDFEMRAKQFPEITCGKNTLSQIYDAVFVHHPRVSYNDEWFTDEIERKLFVASWNNVKNWMEEQSPNALWVNLPSMSERSKNILGQLHIARSLGFRIPETIFTNQLKELRNFADRDIIVIKQGNLGVHIEGKCILTSVVDVDGISAEMLHGCPCFFQKYIPKQFELRVHVIKDTVLTCKIHSQACKNTKIDWRNYDLSNTPHEIYELEDAVRNKCIALVKKLSLAFGVIDIIVTPSGEYVFLECNAQGHWIWIENLTGLPVTETLCDYILNRGSR